MKIFSKKIFCERLKLERMKLGLTQVQIGEALEIPKQYISRWEKGEQSPTLPTLFKLCRYYGVSADYLLGLTDEAKPLD